MTKRNKKKKAPAQSAAAAHAPSAVKPAAADQSPAAEPVATGSSAGTILIPILLVAAFLRLIRIDSPIGGFHAFNEGNYVLIAKNFLHSSLLFPSSDGRYLFLETPPFYPYLLAAVFCFTGVSVLAARILSVLSSLALIVSTFLLGRRLFGKRAALAAALLIAVCPLAVLTGRNIQTDSLLLFLLVTAQFFYLRAESGSKRDWLAFGFLSGLAVFTKLFAVIALVALFAWELLCNRKRQVLKERGFWPALALMIALPVAFYGYHVVRDFAHVRRDVAGGAAVATTFPRSSLEWARMAAEAMWAFSPFLAALLLVGIGVAVARLSREVLFVLLPLAAFSAFYLFVHKHSYYLLTLLPFGALLAGRWLAGLGKRGLRVGLLVTAAMTSAFVSLVDLTGMKLGFSEFQQLGQITGELPGGTHTLLVSRDIRYSYGSVLNFYDPKARLVTLEDLRKIRGGGRQPPEGDCLVLTLVPPQTKSLPSGWLLWRERFGLEMFGWTFAEAHPNPHFFRQGKYVSQQSGGPFDFGFELLRKYPAMALVPVPPGVTLYSTPQGLAIRPSSETKD